MSAKHMTRRRRAVQIAIICLGSIPIIFVASDGHLPYFGSFSSTPSMIPAINPGDLMWVNTMVGFEDIQVGDLVVFRYGGAFVGHRVVNDTGGTLITKGDANGFLDPPLTKDMYVGHIDAVWKFGEAGPFLVYPLPLVWLVCAVACVETIIYHKRLRYVIERMFR